MKNKLFAYVSLNVLVLSIGLCSPLRSSAFPTGCPKEMVFGGQNSIDATGLAKRFKSGEQENPIPDAWELPSEEIRQFNDFIGSSFDHEKALPFLLKHGDLVKAAEVLGELGRFKEAEAMIDNIKATIESSIGATLNYSRVTTRFSNSVHAKKLEVYIKKVFPYLIGRIRKNSSAFDITSAQSCWSMCDTYSHKLSEALDLVGVTTKIDYARRHVYLSYGSVIIDPSIQQFVRHPDMRGIFIGTKAQLKKFILDNPEILLMLDPTETIEHRLWEAWEIGSNPELS